MRGVTSRLNPALLALVVLLTSAVPVSVAAGEPDAALAEAIRVRQEFGFQQGIEFVRRLETDPNVDRSFGIALTRDEAAELKRRVKVELALGPLSEYLASVDGWAGSRWDHPGGHILEISVTDNSAVD